MQNIKLLKIMDLGRYLVGNRKDLKLGFQLVANPKSYNEKMKMPDKISKLLKSQIDEI